MSYDIRNSKRSSDKVNGPLSRTSFSSIPREIIKNEPSRPLKSERAVKRVQSVFTLGGERPCSVRRVLRDRGIFPARRWSAVPAKYPPDGLRSSARGDEFLFDAFFKCRGHRCGFGVVFKTRNSNFMLNRSDGNSIPRTAESDKLLLHYQLTTIVI